MVLLFYLFVPALSSIGLQHRRTGYTYLLTAILVSIFPFAFLYFRELMYPHPPGPRCVNPEFYLIAGNFILFLPLCMGLQWIFNILIRK